MNNHLRFLRILWILYLQDYKNNSWYRLTHCTIRFPNRYYDVVHELLDKADIYYFGDAVINDMFI